VPNRADITVVHFCHAAYRANARDSALASLPRLKAWHERLIRKVSVWAERWSYRERRLRRFVAVSDGLRRELEEFYPGVPCTVAPNGVNHERFRPNQAARPTIRDELGVSPADFVVVFVGGDWVRKGVDIAIAAVGEVRRSHGLAVTLWIVGPGDLAFYRAVARTEGVERQIRFFGPRADTERFYQAADAFVLPSRYETFSLVAVEAAACGLPLIATSLDGVFEEFAAAGAAVISERSPAAVAEAFAQLALNPARRQILGSSARRQSKHYTWERQVSRLLALYHRLISNRRTAAR
jgi:glycosyltransferase involved in cell wall biosynthesis